MKIFLKQILLFGLAITSLIMVGSISISKYLAHQATYNDHSSKPNLILGHSHPEMAFNDSLIQSFRNLADGGESFLYTYQKTKLILSKEPDIKAVFIDFSNNSFDNEKRIKDKLAMDKFYGLYNPFMKTEDEFVLIRNNFPGYISAFAKAILKNSMKIFTGNFNYANQLNGYRYLDESGLDSLDTDNLKIFRQPERLQNKYKNNIDIIYLKKIIDLCLELDKDVYLIRSPVHQKWPGLKNELTYQSIIKEMFGHVDYLDFSNFPLKNSEFADLQHLNYKGAESFSNWFEEVLQDSLLFKKNKQELIDQKISEYHKNRSL